jgi:predicted ribosomally synthesized peptide with SipW-like signal peptide
MITAHANFSNRFIEKWSAVCNSSERQPISARNKQIFSQITYSISEDNMKKRSLIIVVLIASIALLSTGAFAYFTASGKATGNIKSGTLTLAIAGVVPSASCPDSITKDTTTLWDMTNLAPGDELTGKLCMKNTGTLPIPQVGFKWTGMSGLLAENLIVTKLANSRTGDEIGAYNSTCGGADGIMTLAELQACGGGGESEYWVGGVPVFLPVGDTEWVEYSFKFDPNAGNDLQGLNFDYILNITGYQIPKY